LTVVEKNNYPEYSYQTLGMYSNMYFILIGSQGISHTSLIVAEISKSMCENNEFWQMSFLVGCTLKSKSVLQMPLTGWICSCVRVDCIIHTKFERGKL